jgi:hypothetical protein
MHILSLDLSGSVGFARWKPGMDKPASGSVSVGRESPGQTMATFRDFLMDQIIANEITHLVIESAFVSEKNASSAARLFGLAAFADEVAYRRLIGPVERVTAFAWRKFFIGCAKAPTTVAAKHRRKWLKNECVSRCRNLGIDVKSDDEADAVGVLFFERARLLPQYGVEGDLGLRMDAPF